MAMIASAVAQPSCKNCRVACSSGESVRDAVAVGRVGVGEAGVTVTRLPAGKGRPVGVAVCAGPAGRMVAEGVANGTALGVTVAVHTGAALVAARVGAAGDCLGAHAASSSAARQASNPPGAMHLSDIKNLRASAFICG